MEEREGINERKSKNSNKDRQVAYSHMSLISQELMVQSLGSHV